MKRITAWLSRRPVASKTPVQPSARAAQPMRDELRDDDLTVVAGGMMHDAAPAGSSEQTYWANW